MKTRLIKKMTTPAAIRMYPMVWRFATPPRSRLTAKARIAPITKSAMPLPIPMGNSLVAVLV